MNLYPRLKKAFESTSILKIGDYPYPISPFAGIYTPIEPELLSEIVQAAKKELIFKEAELILTFESSGAQLAAVIGQELGLPYLIAKKKKYHLPNEISFTVTTNFDEKNFYIYGEVRGKKILIIDDVIASGATVRNATLALNKNGANVIALFVVAAKTNLIGKKYQDALSEIKIPLISLIKIKIVKDKVIVF